jgi:hypothetical protein
MFDANTTGEKQPKRQEIPKNKEEASIDWGVDQQETQQNENLGRERMVAALQELKEKRERRGESRLRPKVSLRIDGSAIENHQLDIIDVSDDLVNPRSEAYFKLTGGITEKVYQRFREQDEALQSPEGEILDVPREFMVYTPKDKTKTDGFDLADAWKMQKGKITFRISKGTREQYEEIRSTIGLVQAEIDPSASAQELASAFEEFLSEFAGTDEKALHEPGEKDELEYKRARLAWWQKRDVVEVSEEEAKKLVRREVFPGYQTMVMEGFHEPLLEKEPYAIYHEHIGSLDSVPAVVQSGLISTSERRKRGLFASGLSSSEDIMSGGADSVFTRILRTNDTWEDSKIAFPKHGFLYVLKPSLFDRTDVYSYGEDSYGSTHPGYMEYRKTIEETIDSTRGGGIAATNNEQMFRTGIAKEEIVAMVCQDTGWGDWVSAQLEKKGIISLGGIPKEKIHHLDRQAFAKLCANASLEELHGTSVEELIGNMYKDWVVKKTQEEGVVKLGNKTIEEIWVMDEAIRRTFLEQLHSDPNTWKQFKMVPLHQMIMWFDDGDQRTGLLRRFREQGVQEVNGVPVQEFVRYASEDRNIIDIATKGRYSNRLLDRPQAQE